MPRERVDREANSTSMPAFEWSGVHALKRVHALNERCLEVMAHLARSNREKSSVEIISQFRDLWCGLDAAARQRAARCPVLLLSLHFNNEEWWRWASEPRSKSRRGMPRSCFPASNAVELMRETLMLAWSIAGADRSAATVLLGATPVVSNIIAELGPQHVERIAVLHSCSLHLRWADFPPFWKKLLQAARAGDEDLLHDIRLHCIQLLGGELIPMLGHSTSH